MEFLISKTSVELYRLRASNGSYWAEIMIDTSPELHSGRISICSDWGNWNSYWGSCGVPFKQFLRSCDDSYLMGKFAARDYFDAEATANLFQENVSERTDLDSRTRKALLAEIREVRSSASIDEALSVLLSGKLVLLYDGAPPIVKDFDPLLVKFMTSVWPQFMARLKEEEASTCENEQ